MAYLSLHLFGRNGAVAVIAMATLLISILATGCAPIFSAQKSSFDRLPSTIQGKKVYFVPNDNQKISTAYHVYSDLVAQELFHHGIQRTENPDEANYALVMDYGLAGERQKTHTVPIYGMTGGETSYHEGKISIFGSYGSSFGTYTGTTRTSPSFGVVGVESHNYTAYDLYLYMIIVDIDKSTQNNIVPVYEGTVMNTGYSSSFDKVSRCMIKALFENFRSSGSRTVEFPVETGCGH